MKTLAVTTLSLFLVLSPSQAKTSAGVQVQESQKRSVLKTPMRTKSVLARVVPRAHRRLFVTNDLSDGDDGPAGSDELDLHCAYRRPELSNSNSIDADDDELSDYVKTRLFVARARALEKYKETWG